MSRLVGTFLVPCMLKVEDDGSISEAIADERWLLNTRVEIYGDNLTDATLIPNAAFIREKESSDAS